ETADPEPFIDLARADLAAGDAKRARQAADEALRRSAGHPWAMAVMGTALVRDGQRAAGLNYLERAMNAGPRRPAVWQSLAAGFGDAATSPPSTACASASRPWDR